MRWQPWKYRGRGTMCKTNLVSTTDTTKGDHHYWLVSEKVIFSSKKKQEGSRGNVFLLNKKPNGKHEAEWEIPSRKISGKVHTRPPSVHMCATSSAYCAERFFGEMRDQTAIRGCLQQGPKRTIAHVQRIDLFFKTKNLLCTERPRLGPREGHQSKSQLPDG